MFRAPPRPSSGAYNCINSLWFHRWSVGDSSVAYYLKVYVSLNMFRAPPRPSSGAYNCINSLWFHRWSVDDSSVAYYLKVYVSLNMFRASPHPSSGAYNCINSLWFHRWSVGGSSYAAITNAPTVKPEAVNLLAPEFYIWILAHPVGKM